jgi:hypothetical protein
MQDLRLVGVHDDGEHLLLSGTGGEMFQLPIDEALRVAASRSSAKFAGRSGATPVAMSPRDIQAKIRSGLTAAEVSDLSGIPLAKVERYEGPVLAEREYVAQQARKIEVATPAPGHDAYRAAFGDNPASLGDMVAHRLTAHGIEPASVEWDSWRRPDGTWTVVARFEARTEGGSNIGEEPPAMWTFSPSRKSLQNANRWAQQLSELEPLDGPVPARRLSAVSDRPFDFETDAAAAARNSSSRQGSGQQGSGQQGPGQQAPPQGKDSDGLLDMLRSRRGQRLGMDEDGDDALALLLTNGVPAAHPRPSEVVGEQDYSPDSSSRPDSDQDGDIPAAHSTAPERSREGRPSILSRLSLASRAVHDDGDDSLKLHDGISTDTREITIVPRPGRPDSAPARPDPQGNNIGLDELLGGSRRPPSDAAPGTRPERDAEPPERPSKPKRSSVPSWDEIVFGTRGD